MFSSVMDDSNKNEAEMLANQANSLENDQQSMLENSLVEQQYEALLRDYISQKHEQVSRIEEKLGQLLQRQQFQMQKVLMTKPNMFSLPKTKRLWQGQVAQQKGAIARIEGRLTAVKDIKSSMGLHEPRIDEMAAKKLRKDNPSLCREYDFFKVMERKEKANARDKTKEKKQTKKMSKSLSRAKTSPL